MSYIGNLPTSATFAIDTFSGDNSTVNFTLREAPAATSSLMVFVGGIRQQIESYSLSGITLTFSEAPPTGSSNIQVVFLGLGAMSNIPSDGTITSVKLAAGIITNDKLAAGAITGDKFGLTSINANNIVNASITGDKLGLTSINANNIVDGTITNAKLTTPGATTGKAIAMAIVFGG